MNIYILYKSPYTNKDSMSDLAIYKLVLHNEKHIFRFFGECESYVVKNKGGMKNIVLSKFKHSGEIKKEKISPFDFIEPVIHYLDVDN